MQNTESVICLLKKKIILVWSKNYKRESQLLNLKVSGKIFSLSAQQGLNNT